MDILNNISELVQKGKAKDVKELVNKALDENVEPNKILTEGLIKGITILGGKFKLNQVFVPEVLIAARAMNQGLGVLRPALTASGIKPIGKAIICTVKGDLHDIGKNLVKMMLEGQGIDCIDLGVDISPQQIVDAIIEHKPQIVCLSALLTTTMMAQKETIDAIVANGLRDQVKIMVGGAPVTQDYAEQIGADIYAADSATAAEMARDLLVGGQ